MSPMHGALCTGLIGSHRVAVGTPSSEMAERLVHAMPKKAKWQKKQFVSSSGIGDREDLSGSNACQGLIPLSWSNKHLRLHGLMPAKIAPYAPVLFKKISWQPRDIYIITYLPIFITSLRSSGCSPPPI